MYSVWHAGGLLIVFAVILAAVALEAWADVRVDSDTNTTHMTIGLFSATTRRGSVQWTNTTTAVCEEVARLFPWDAAKKMPCDAVRAGLILAAVGCLTALFTFLVLGAVAAWKSRIRFTVVLYAYVAIFVALVIALISFSCTVVTSLRDFIGFQSMVTVGPSYVLLVVGTGVSFVGAATYAVLRVCHFRGIKQVPITTQTPSIHTTRECNPMNDVFASRSPGRPRSQNRVLCPDDGFCTLLNSNEHRERFLHKCTLMSGCPYLSEKHRVEFSH